MADELFGFRNQLWWGAGRWNGAAVWSLDVEPGEVVAGAGAGDARAVACLERGECPECGLPITWAGFVPMRYLPEMGGRSLGDGYWQLPAVRPPPRLYTDAELVGESPGHTIVGQLLGRSLGGSYMPAELAQARLDEFSRQHRRFVSGWLWRRETEPESERGCG